MADLDQHQAASRFVSSADLEVKRAAEDEEWRAAYARIGQEPPPQEVKLDEVHDTRTLYEKLQAAETAKTEEWDEKMKLGNQYRGLHDEELQFLNDTEAKKKAKDMRIKAEENEELKAYYEALAAKERAPPPDFSADVPAVQQKKPVLGTGKPVRKDVKSLLKGVVVKKKPKVAAAAGVKPAPTTGFTRAMPSVPTGGSGREPQTALRKRSLTPEEEENVEGDKKQRTVE